MRLRPGPRPQPRRRHPRADAPPTPGSAADARRADRSIVIAAVVMSITGFALRMWAIADLVLLVFEGALMALFLRGLSRAVQHAATVVVLVRALYVEGDEPPEAAPSGGAK